jgi:hypothetical protein
VRVRGVAALAAATLVLGCRTALPPAVPLASDDPRPIRMLAELAERSERLDALRGMAKLSVDGPGGSLRSRQVLVAARPARLRVEILGFLSQTQAVLVTDGAEYSLFDAREQSFESAPLRPGLLLGIAGIDLEPDEVVRVLLGAPHLEALSARQAFQLPEGGLQVLLRDLEHGAQRAVEFGPDGGLRRYAAWDPDGVPAFDAQYDDVQSVGEFSFAHRIDIQFPASGIEARIDLSRIGLNPELGPAVFDLDIPTGAAGGRG